MHIFVTIVVKIHKSFSHGQIDSPQGFINLYKKQKHIFSF